MSSASLAGSMEDSNGRHKDVPSNELRDTSQVVKTVASHCCPCNYEKLFSVLSGMARSCVSDKCVEFLQRI